MKYKGNKAQRKCCRMLTIKCKAWAFVLVLLVSAAFPIKSATATETMCLAVTTVSHAHPDTSYVIDATIGANANIYVMQFAIAYDSTRLELESATSGSAMNGLGGLTINTNIAGYVYVSWETIVEPIRDAGSILTMSFRTKESSEGFASIAIDTTESMVFTNEEYSPLNITFEDGGLQIDSLTVVDAVDATCTCSGLTEGLFCPICNVFIVEQQIIEALGHSFLGPEWLWEETDIGYDVEAIFICENDSTHIHRVEAEVSCTSVPPTYTQNGEIRYTATVSFLDNDYTDEKSFILESLILFGDVNMDKEVTSADAAEVLRHIVHLKTLSEEQVYRGNVDGGDISSSDAACILRFVVKIITAFPVEG
ncbi:MAG: cohesin domain-containing protein [Clostridia bacterium]|nr:cohesin domain-containing protein [Clostridia bacterium]